MDSTVSKKRVRRGTILSAVASIFKKTCAIVMNKIIIGRQLNKKVKKTSNFHSF